MPTICAEEEIFVNHRAKIAFNGQPCGVILAESFDVANYAATKVNVIYGEKYSYSRFRLFLLVYYNFRF